MNMQRSFPAFLLLGVVAAVGFWPADAQEKENPYGVVATLKGHSELVYSVAFSDDGKLLATGSFDNTVKLWETASSKEIRTFGGPAGHQKMVLTVAVSPNGQLLASGSADNTLKVWDIPSTTPLQTLASEDGVTSLTLNPDGKKLATAGKDGLVQVWDAATLKPQLKLTGHAGPVTSVAFSANNQFLATSGADKTLRFWNAADGKVLGDIGAHAGSANAVVLNPNNTIAYSVGDDGLLKFWQVPPPATRPLPAHGEAVLAIAMSADGSQVFTGGNDKAVKQSPFAPKETRAFAGANAAIRSLAVNPNTSVLAAGTGENNLVLWNVADGKVIDQLQAHRGAVTGVSFHPQNTQLLTAGGDGLLKLWSFPLIPGRALTHPEAVLSAAATPDGKQLFTGSADKLLRAWDVTKNAVLRQFTGHTGPVTAVAVSGNGQTLASGSADQTIRIWNQAMGKEAAILGAHAGPVTSLAVNAAGTQLLSAGADGVKLWQLPVAAPRPLAHPDQVTCLAISPDGSRVLTGCADKQARLWNFKTGAKERDLSGHTLTITALAFSGNDQLVATGSADKSAIVWNPGDGKLLKKVALPAQANAIVFAPDAKSLIVGVADNSIRIFELDPKDAKEPKELKNLAAHKAPITGLAMTPKGDILASGSEDKSVTLWNLKDGSSIKKLEHPEPILDLALSKDGSRLAATGAKTIKIWTIPDGKEIASFAGSAETSGLAFAPDGKALLISGKDKQARLVDLDGKLLEFFVHDGPVQAAAFVDAKQFVTASADKLARAWTTSLVAHKPADAGTRAIFSPKGDQIIAGGAKGVKFWSAADGKDLRAIEAHEAMVGFDVSGDAGRLVTAGADKTVKVWTPKDDKKPASVITLDIAPKAIALSPNGLRLAVVVSDDKSTIIRVLDADNGKELQSFSDHGGAVTSLEFLGDSKTLFSTSQDKSARLLTLSVLAALDAHKDGVVGVQFHSNGTQALSAGADKTAKLWDLAKGTVIKTFGPTTEDIKAVTFSRDFNQVAVAAGKKAIIWNAGDGKQLAELTHPADVLSLSFNQDKTRLATGATDKLARAWEIATGKELQFFDAAEPVASVLFDAKGTGVVYAGGKTPQADTLSIIRAVPVAPGPVTALALNPANTHVLTGGSDKAVKLWNVNTGALERTIPGTEDIQSIAVSKNNVLIAAGANDKTVRLFNFADAKEIGAVKTAGAVKTLSFSPNNVALAGGCADGAVLTWDVTFTPGQPLPPTFLKPIQSFAQKEAITRVEFAADNATILSSSLDKSVQAWRLASLTPTRNFPHPNHVDSVAFHPKGDQLASGGHDGKVRIFDLVKGAQLREINAHPTANATMIYCVAYSQDGSKVLSAGYDNSLKVWDANSGNLIREFKAYKVKDFEKGHQDPVFSAAFSPDGKYVVSGSGGLERLIKIWNLADGSVVRDLANPELAKNNPKAPPRSHPGWVYKLRFSKDGKYLVSIGDAPMNKGYLAVWNPEDGKMLYGAALPLGTFFGLAISPDEKLLAIGAGPRGRASPDFNCAYLLRWPLSK